jgi:hypothetical protein
VQEGFNFTEFRLGLKMSNKIKTKREKNKIGKLIEKSDSENDDNEHELSFYINDRVKLMKEVLKIIKPKKIKSMAPDCIKDLDIGEINSMLLEELLGISNKRLKYIFNGQNLGEDSSSTDPEEEKQPIDIISLDDVSDDDFVIDVDSDQQKKKRHVKVKQESTVKKLKREKHQKKSNDEKEGPLQEENLMSVLELLELQARARAIRSQLMLEANKKAPQQTEIKADEDSDDDAVIIETPKHEEIVINSSDSENEQQKQKGTNSIENFELSNITDVQSQKKIKLIRDRIDKEIANNAAQNTENSNVEVKEKETGVNATNDEVEINNDPIVENQEKETDEGNEASNKKSSQPEAESNNDEDEIILIVDQEEMDGIMGD